MEKLLIAIKKVLDVLPFDGDKTKLAVVILCYAVLRTYVPEAGNLEELWEYITGNIAVPFGGVVAFLLHKYLKVKVPDKKWGGSVE